MYYIHVSTPQKLFIYSCKFPISLYFLYDLYLLVSTTYNIRNIGYIGVTKI